MKRVVYALFSLCYIWGTVTVAGERSSRFAEWLGHTATPETDQVHAPCSHSTNELPNFSHAENAKTNAAELSLDDFYAPEAVVRRLVGWNEDPFLPERDSTNDPSRAPPAPI
jgi:hypothetical protein